jgi:hypothetical protein
LSLEALLWADGVLLLFASALLRPARLSGLSEIGPVC